MFFLVLLCEVLQGIDTNLVGGLEHLDYFFIYWE
jgi:hypothetical protein